MPLFVLSRLSASVCSAFYARCVPTFRFHPAQQDALHSAPNRKFKSGSKPRALSLLGPFIVTSASLALRFSVILVVLGAITVPGFSQVQPTDMNLDTGIKPNETFDRAQENVNIGSGNLSIQIPLVHLSGRNGHDFDLSLTYNSQNWSPVASEYQPNDTTDVYIGWSYAQNGPYGIGSTGWQLNIPVLYATGVTIPPQMCPNGPCGYPDYSQSSSWTNFYLVMGDGRKYQFPQARIESYTQETQCSTACNINTYAVPSSDVLLDYDGGESQGSPGPNGDGSGEGVLLDLTNVTNGTGTAVVRFRDGSQIQFTMDTGWQTTSASGPMSVAASALVDSNGNAISINGNVITDTVNRKITLLGNGVQYTDSNGTPRTITFNYSQFPSSPAPKPQFSSPAVGSNGIMGVASGAIGSMLSSIVLPDGLTYTFQYNEYGEILESTYPTGGYTRYVYQAFPVNEYEWSFGNTGMADNREVVDRYICPAVAVSAGATAPAGYVGSSVSSTCPVAENHTNYRRPATQMNPVTVTDALGNQIVYTFGGGACDATAQPSSYNEIVNYAYGVASMESVRSEYQGSSTLLRTVNTGYQGCYKNSETVILPNQQTSNTTWSIDTSKNLSSTLTVNDHGSTISIPVYAETDNVISKKEYDFGPSAPGLLLRQTIYSYLSTNPVSNANYQPLPIYILDRKRSETVQDGGGNQVSQVTYEYDNYLGGIVASGAIQHGITGNTFGPAYTTRGNMTAVTRWRNTDGALLTHRNFQFDDAGNILIKTDPAGNQTGYSYADVWSNTTCAPTGSISAAYLSNIINALGQSTSLTYNSCTGTLAELTDANLQATTFGYDVMDRRVLVRYPDTGQTCLQYSDAQNPLCPSYSGPTLPINIVSSQKINSDVSKISTTVLDGLSRQVQGQLNSDPGGTDYVDTTYDGVGNVNSVSNPYRSQDDPTYGITSFQYDGLGRKLLQCQPDNGSNIPCQLGSSYLQWSYNENARAGSPPTAGDVTIYYDELRNSWQRTSDALGRLKNLTEPGGLQTVYSYDALDNLTNVNQIRVSAKGEYPVTRSFAYDSLSHLVAANNPENASSVNPASLTCVPGGPWTTCYTYDLDENVKTKTDNRNTTTTYSYEALNRLTSKTYSNSGALSSCYQYDAKIIPNAVGRLVNEWTQPGACPGSSTGVSSSAVSWKSILSYDPMGRVKSEQQCALAPCSTPNQLQHSYDLAGDVSYSDGVQYLQNLIGLTYSFDGAGRLAALSSTSGGATSSTPLFQANQPNSYGPLGLTAAQVGFSDTTQSPVLSQTLGYDNRGRLITKNVLGAGLAPTSAGTLQITPSAVAQGVTVFFSNACGDICGSGTGSLYLDGAIPQGSGFTYSPSASFAWHVSTSNLSLGQHSAYVQYSGDATHPPLQTSTTYFTVQENQLPASSLDVTIDPPTIPNGEEATATAQTTCGKGACSGIVEFNIAGTGWVMDASTDDNGNASVILPNTLVVGSYTLNVRYDGDAMDSPADSTVPFTVVENTLPQPTINVTLAPDSIPAGEYSTITVTSSCNNACGGANILIDGSYNNSFVFDSTGGAQVFLNTTQLSVAQHNLQIQYLGDTSNAPTTPNFLFEVVANNLPIPVITLSVPQPTIPAGLLGTVTVSASCGASCGSPAQGYLYANGNYAGGFVLDSTGNAIVTTGTTTLSPGQYQLTAQFFGNSSWNNATSAPLPLTVQ